MPIHRRILSVLAVALITVLTVGCGKDDNPTTPTTATNRITVTGTGFSGTPRDHRNAFGAWSASTGRTMVVVTDSSLSSVMAADNFPGDGFAVTFKGSSTGTFNIVFGDTTTVVVAFSGGRTLMAYSGSLNVTEYGAVGGTIRGTFQGKGLALRSNILEMPDTVDISLSFAATRLSDTTNLIRDDDGVKENDPTMTLTFSNSQTGQAFFTNPTDVSWLHETATVLVDGGPQTAQLVRTYGTAEIEGSIYDITLEMMWVAPSLTAAGTYPWDLARVDGSKGVMITITPRGSEVPTYTFGGTIGATLTSVDDQSSTVTIDLAGSGSQLGTTDEEPTIAISASITLPLND